MMAKQFLAYMTSLWSVRHFWWLLARLDLQVRYRRSSLGICWSLLNPIAMTIVVSFVFHRVLQQDVMTYAPFLMIGLSFWNFVCHVVLQGSQTFVQGQQYLRQNPLPAASLPLTTALSGAFHLLLALSVVVLFSWCTRGFGNLCYLPAVLPALVMLFLFGWALATLTGLCNVYFPDTILLTDVALRMAFFLTPVLYPPHVVQTPGLGWLVTYNPFAACLELLRAPILDNHLPTATSVLVASGGVVLLISLAALAIGKLESRLVYYL
jgi:lipopolysaccharide transport system permease protein